MKASLRILMKELQELIANPRALLVFLMAPVMILILVGRLQVHPPKLDVLVGGMGNCDNVREGEDETANFIYLFMQELSWVNLQCASETSSDPLGQISQSNLDLLLNVNEGLNDRWVIYLADTSPQRMVWRYQLAQGIQISRSLMEEGNTEEPEIILFMLGSLGAMPVRSAFHYFPQSTRLSIANIPGTFALILCFLPFVFTAAAMSRERESHTLEVLMTTSRIRGQHIMVGKCVAAVIISLACAALMMLTVQAAFQIYIKPDALLFTLFLVLPILSSALLGLCVSVLARTQSQILLAAAVYFLCLLLLTGFLYPLDGSSAVIWAVSNVFSLTFLIEPINAWMFGAQFRQNSIQPAIFLALQCIAYSAIAWLAWRWSQKRF